MRQGGSSNTNTDHVTEEIGFIDLGMMGQLMALNLTAMGTTLVVWNRSADRCEPLSAAGANIEAWTAAGSTSCVGSTS